MLFFRGLACLECLGYSAVVDLAKLAAVDLLDCMGFLATKLVFFWVLLECLCVCNAVHPQVYSTIRKLNDIYFLANLVDLRFLGCLLCESLTVGLS